MEHTPHDAAQLSFVQGAENEVAHSILMHCPGQEAFIATLHPTSALFERPVHLKRAKQAHRLFQQTLRAFGLNVRLVRDVLLQDCETDPKARRELEDFAVSHLQYVWAHNGVVSAANAVLNPTAGAQHGPHGRACFIDEHYKRDVIGALDSESLVNLLLCNPTIILQKANRETPVTASYIFNPLGNLVFTRDQQITTSKGIVMANMHPKQRKPEVSIMKFCWQKLGFPVVGHVPEPHTLEGGDFLPAGPDLCFLGVGPRTSEGAAQYLMDNDLFGTRQVAVVKDVFERSQKHMHLDTVFNIASDRCVVLQESLIGPTAPLRRLVDEYTRDEDGRYRLTQWDVEFSQYLRDQGYEVVPIPEECQRGYGINFVNLGNSHLVCCDQKTKALLEAHPQFRADGGRVTYMPYDGVTAMYGGPHCSSQLARVPRAGGDSAPKSEASLDQESVLREDVRLVIPTELPHKQSVQEQMLLEYSFVHRRLVEAGLNVRIVLTPPEAGTDVPAVRRVFKKKEERRETLEDCLKDFVVSLGGDGGTEPPIRQVLDSRSGHETLQDMTHKLATMSVSSAQQAGVTTDRDHDRGQTLFKAT